MRAASLFSEDAIHVTLVYALCHRQPVHLTYRRTLANDFPIFTSVEWLACLQQRSAEGAFVPACHMAELADKDFVEGGQYLGSGAWSGQYSR